MLGLPLTPKLRGWTEVAPCERRPGKLALIACAPQARFPSPLQAPGRPRDCGSQGAPVQADPAAKRDGSVFARARNCYAQANKLRDIMLTKIILTSVNYSFRKFIHPIHVKGVTAEMLSLPMLLTGSRGRMAESVRIGLDSEQRPASLTNFVQCGNQRVSQALFFGSRKCPLGSIVRPNGGKWASRTLAACNAKESDNVRHG